MQLIPELMATAQLAFSSRVGSSPVQIVFEVELEIGTAGFLLAPVAYHALLGVVALAWSTTHFH